MAALKAVGVPYTQNDMESAKEAVQGVSEMNALIAYLQNLGKAYERTLEIRKQQANNE